MNAIELEPLTRKLEVLKLAILGLDSHTLVSEHEKYCLSELCAELIDQVSDFIRKGEESDKQG